MQNKSTISYLKFFHGFIKFGKGVSAIYIIIIVISSFFSPAEIDIPIEYRIPNAGTIQSNNLQTTEVFIFKGEGNLRYKGGKDQVFTGIAGFNIFSKIILAIAGFFVYFLLEKIVKSTIDKKPFIQENADRMKWLGYIFISAGILSVLNNILGAFFLEGNFSSDIIKQDSLEAQFGKYFIQLLINRGTILGLFALLVSQILKYGIQLKEETELTI